MGKHNGSHLAQGSDIVSSFQPGWRITRAMESEPMAAMAAPASSGQSASSAQAPAEEEPKKGRTKRPRIDLDDSISQAKKAMKEAQKSVAEARKIGRNERRKKQRLLKKAIGLSAEDLERIAVLKRCGLQNASPKASDTPEDAVQPPAAASASSSRPEPQAAAGSDSPAQTMAGNTAMGEELDDDHDDE